MMAGALFFCPSLVQKTQTKVLLLLLFLICTHTHNNRLQFALNDDKMSKKRMDD